MRGHLGSARGPWLISCGGDRSGGVPQAGVGQRINSAGRRPVDRISSSRSRWRRSWRRSWRGRGRGRSSAGRNWRPYRHLSVITIWALKSRDGSRRRFRRPICASKSRDGSSAGIRGRRDRGCDWLVPDWRVGSWTSWRSNWRSNRRSAGRSAGRSNRRSAGRSAGLTVGLKCQLLHLSPVGGSSCIDSASVGGCSFVSGLTVSLSALL